MRTIYKYPFTVNDHVEVVMPQGADILHVAWLPNTAPSDLVLWATVDPDSPPWTHNLVVRGTGHPFQGNEGRHLGTVVVDGGVLIWHVFEQWVAPGIAPDYAESAE